MPDRAGARILIADRKRAEPDSQTEGAKMNLIASIKPKMHVKIGILAFGLIPISVAAACSTNVAASTKAHDDSFTVGESPKIVVNGSNGRIKVSAGTDDTVRVQAT